MRVRETHGCYLIIQEKIEFESVRFGEERPDLDHEVYKLLPFLEDGGRIQMYRLFERGPITFTVTRVVSSIGSATANGTHRKVRVILPIQIACMIDTGGINMIWCGDIDTVRIMEIDGVGVQ